MNKLNNNIINHWPSFYIGDDSVWFPTSPFSFIPEETGQSSEFYCHGLNMDAEVQFEQQLANRRHATELLSKGDADNVLWESSSESDSQQCDQVNMDSCSHDMDEVWEDEESDEDNESTSTLNQ